LGEARRRKLMEKKFIEDEKPIGECFCRDCEFWKFLPEAGTSNGICCANPPQVSRLLVPGKLANTMEMNIQSNFPMTGGYRSCGQGRKKREEYR
jgi:hypothetical protein